MVSKIQKDLLGLSGCTHNTNLLFFPRHKSTSRNGQTNLYGKYFLCVLLLNANVLECNECFNLNKVTGITKLDECTLVTAEQLKAESFYAVNLFLFICISVYHEDRLPHRKTESILQNSNHIVTWNQRVSPVTQNYSNFKKNDGSEERRLHLV